MRNLASADAAPNEVIRSNNLGKMKQTKVRQRDAALSLGSADWIGAIHRKLQSRRDRHAPELDRIIEQFGDPGLLAGSYVEPRVEYHPSFDHAGLDRTDADAVTPVFTAINHFLTTDTPLRGSCPVLFVLSDAGAGKTSLMLMLKLGHLFGFWPKDLQCTLLKPGPGTLDVLAAHADKGDTVLMLDALNEDGTAVGRTRARLQELLQAANQFRRVIISCRSDSFPQLDFASPFDSEEHGNAGLRCARCFILPFNGEQTDAYLRKRFPDHLLDRVLSRPNHRRKRAEALVSSLGSIGSHPLLLTHIERLLDAEVELSPQAPSAREIAPTDCRLYQALLHVWLTPEKRSGARPSEPPEHPSPLAAVCMRIAVYLQVTGRPGLTSDELTTLIGGRRALCDLGKRDVLGHSPLHRGTDGTYRFPHHGMQEHLVARALEDGFLELSSGLFRFDPAAASDEDTAAVQALADGQRLRISPEMRAALACRDIVLDATRVDLSDLLPEALAGLCICHPLQDGGQGPPMQLVAPGRFLMGSAEGEADSHADERPRHDVRIGTAFCVGRFPVTFEDYDRFCEATGRQKPADEGWGRGTRPVINVGWDDANAYCEWLSAQCGASYRLPTEAEWEYACRAGSSTRWSFGDEEGDLDAHAWYEANADGRTQPVGKKRPNAWGLYDCYGNIWEWVEDCWHGSYEGAPDDGGAWWESDGGDARLRVLRGGSGGDRPDGVRSACRFRSPPSGRDHFVGFRVLCASPFDEGPAR